jgi:hypothetical protein
LILAPAAVFGSLVGILRIWGLSDVDFEGWGRVIGVAIDLLIAVPGGRGAIVIVGIDGIS